ncbi:MAG: hypothetical protein R3Y60_04305 [bacterium]
MKKFFAGIFVLICGLSLFACDFSSSSNQFGYFTENGYSLTSFVKEDITYNQAIDLVGKAPYKNVSKALNSYSTSDISITSDMYDSLGLTTDEIKAIETVYKSVTVTTNYWHQGKQFSKVDEEYELDQILGNNKFSIVNSIVVNNIVITSDLLDYYQDIDLEFQAQDNYSSAPFKHKYSHHTSTDGLLVLSISDYSTNTSVATGTNTMEIHQTEAIYNNYNLISKYQASFGFRYPTPGGTEYVGTVLELSFEWNIKT